MEIIYAGIAALLLALIHLFGHKLALEKNLNHRIVVSAGGGISIAYIFLQLLPELQQGQQLIHKELGQSLSYIEHHLYLVALVGLLVFYSLEKYVQLQKKHSSGGGFWLHIFSFTVYNILIGDLLLERIHESGMVLTLFTIAMLAHFLVNDIGMYQHHKKLYIKKGRWFPAAGVILGFALSAVFKISHMVWLVTFGLIAGSTIMNALKEELPEEKESSLPWFVGAAVVYSLVLLAATG